MLVERTGASYYRGNYETMQRHIMERLGQTHKSQKREGDVRKKERKRRSASDAVEFLKGNFEREEALYEKESEVN